MREGSVKLYFDLWMDLDSDGRRFEEFRRDLPYSLYTGVTYDKYQQGLYGGDGTRYHKRMTCFSGKPFDGIPAMLLSEMERYLPALETWDERSLKDGGEWLSLHSPTGSEKRGPVTLSNSRNPFHWLREDEVWTNRKFSIWELHTSHGHLLLRSPKAKALESGHQGNIDIMFRGVRFFDLPTKMDGLEFTSPTMQEVDGLVSNYGDLKPLKPWVLVSGGTRHLVLAAAAVFIWRNDWELLESPIEFRPRKHEGEAGPLRASLISMFPSLREANRSSADLALDLTSLKRESLDGPLSVWHFDHVQSRLLLHRFKWEDESSPWQRNLNLDFLFRGVRYMSLPWWLKHEVSFDVASPEELHELSRKLGFPVLGTQVWVPVSQGVRYFIIADSVEVSENDHYDIEWETSCRYRNPWKETQMVSFENVIRQHAFDRDIW